MDYLQYSTNKRFKGYGILVLNLIINGLPSILNNIHDMYVCCNMVLNLIINGLPSIL